MTSQYGPHWKTSAENPNLDIWENMTIDYIGLIGIAIGVAGIFDYRRERLKREKSVIAARALIERMYGMLIVLKPSVSSSFTPALDDGLGAINEARKDLKQL